MADDMDGTPPPLPSSLPPSLEISVTGRKRSASKKFLDLQAQMSSSKTMYNTSGGKYQKQFIAPAVHPKPSVKLKRGAGDANLEDSVDFQKSPIQSQRLVHHTLERPKRKGIRTPTRGSRNMLSDLPPKTAMNGAIPTGTSLVSAPPDYDQPPPLPPSAPPPEAVLTGDNEHKFMEEITSNNILTEPPLLPSNDPPSLYNESSPLDFPPPLDKPPPLSDSPPLPSSLPPSLDDQPPLSSSYELTNSELPALNHTSLLQEPVSLNKLLPSDKSLFMNMPPPADELPPLPPANDLPSPPTSLPPLIHCEAPSIDQPSVDDSSTFDMTDSSSFEAPPPLPSSLPPEIHKSTSPPTIEGVPIVTADIEPPVTQSFTSGNTLLKYGTTNKQERTPSPLATKSPLHDSQNTSGGLKSHGQSTNSSFPMLVSSVVTANAITSTPIEAAKPTADSSSASKFRDRIARLKQKRESINPSPALSEKVTDNSRVTSPLMSSYSTPFLEETSDKPHSHKLQADHSADHSTSISPLLSSTEELNTPVSFPTTTNKFTTIPRTTRATSSEVVEPTFTVRKISSSRITSGAASISKEESKPPASINTAVDSHSDSAFTKFNISDNMVLESGLPVNDDDNNRSEDDSSPPPLPSSLPPGAFESDSFLGVVSDDAGMPPNTLPPVIPAATVYVVMDGKNMTGQEVAPPLPTSPVPFEIPTSSSNALPLFEPFKPPKEPVNTAQEEVVSESHDLSAPVEFSENVNNNIIKPSASLIQKSTGVENIELPANSSHKTGLHTAVFANYSPKTVRPFSQYYTKDTDYSSQQKDNRHSVHLDTELDIRSRSNSLPIFVCEQLVTDEKTMKPSKKSSSKLKFPWQKKLAPDRSNSMSTDRPQHKSKKEHSDSWRHSSADMKGGTSGSDLMRAQHRNVGSLQQAAGHPLGSSSTDDLRNSRQLIGSNNSVSTSHSQLYNSRLLPPPVQFTASETSIPKLSDDEPSTLKQQLQQKQQLIKDADKLAASNVSLPHMTTPELYRKLTQPSDPSLLESVMKDITHLHTIEDSPIPQEDDKETPSNHEGHLSAAKTVDKEVTKVAKDEEKQLDASPNKTGGSVGSLNEVPSPLGSPLQLQSSFPNINEGRGTHGSVGSISTLVSSNDSQRDLSKHRVTIGDWSVDNVSHWLKSIDLYDVVPVFQQHSVDGAKLKSLDDDKLTEIGIQPSLLREQILQEIWELLAANDETAGRTRPRKTKSLLQGMSVMRKGLEAQLQDRMSEDLTLMQTMGQQQQEMLDSRLAALQEQREQTQELLEGGLSAFMNTISSGSQKKRALRKKSSIAESDIDAEYWSVDQVCGWLDEVGLGYYVTIFQEYQIDGSALCSLDMQTFAEMGVDSAEDRETILAQIYELFNPDSDGYKNDNMEALLEGYSGEDLEKMKAVISALKNPEADDDDLEIESSPPPFYLGFANGAAGIEALSHSTPMLADTSYDDSIPGTPEARHVRQGSFPHMRPSQRRPPPQSVPYAQFLVSPKQTGGTSSVENTPPPLPKKKENVYPPAEDEPQGQTPSPVATSTPAATSPQSNEVAEQSDKLQELPVSTEYPTKLASKLAAKKRKQSSGDVIESVSTEQPKPTQPAATPAAAATTANNKDVAYKMKQLANQLSHGEVTIESDASGVKISENDQPNRYKRSRSGIGKKINTVKIKSGGMQSGLVRLYMVDIPHFSHVIYQAYLILASTTSHEVIEQVLKKADIVDDPYRYYIYERNMDEDSHGGTVLERSDCPLQLQMEWTNFYGRKFELYCRKTQFINVQCQIKGLPTDTTQMHITEVTPCSVLITMATNSFKVPENCGKLKIVCMHIKNKREKELSDTDLPLRLITANNAKYIVFCLRQDAEPTEPTQKQQQQAKEETNTTAPPVQSEGVKVQSPKEAAGTSKAPPPTQTVSSSQLAEVKEKCAMLENEKEHLETKLDELQKRYNAVAMESNNEAIILMEQENNKLSSKLAEYKSKCAQHNQEITEMAENLQNWQQQLMDKDDHIQELTVTNNQLQEQTKQFQEQITQYQHQETESSKTIQNLKEAVEKLTIDHQETQELVEQLRHENEQLEQSVKDKKDETALNSSTPEVSDEMATLKELLNKQEKDLSSYKKKCQKQSQQLKATEDQLNSMKKVLKQKDEVITQLSEVEPIWQSGSNRNSLYSMMGTEQVGTLLSVTVEPQETGLGIKLSSTEGTGCLVMQVAEHSPLVSTVFPGDRLLEINGEDISNSTTKQVVSLLKNLNEPMQFVIMRHGVQDKHNDKKDNGSDDMIERLQKLNATLTEQVDKQMAETQHWRSQYEQTRDASSNSALLQQEKDSEIAYYKTTVEELKEQLTEGQKMQEQLQKMLEELHQTHDEHSKEATETMDETLQEHAEQLEIMETKHKNQVQALQKSVKEKDNTVKLFQQHLVMTNPIDSSSLQACRKTVNDLKSASQPEVLEALARSEEEATRHQAYLDKLLVVVIERCPELLGTMSATAGNDRNKAEEWC